MGITPGEVMEYNYEDLTKEERKELLEIIAKNTMKDIRGAKLIATAQRRENARLKKELATAARNTGNVTTFKK